MIQNKILIIEDDKEINALLGKVLAAEGFKTKSAFNGIAGLDLALSEDFRLILVDLMLPFKSGDEILRQIRKHSSVPVIVISAKEMVRTKIDLLHLGADDYITKPFDIDEVVARIETVLRRYAGSHLHDDFLIYQDIVIDCEAKRVEVSGHELSITAMEYYILELFVKNPAKIFSKRNLFESVSGEEYLSDDNTVNVHISNIRSKLRKYGREEKYIETVYGMGYRMAKI